MYFNLTYIKNMKTSLNIFLLVVLFFGAMSQSYAQDKFEDEPQVIFNKIESGIKEFDVNRFSDYFQSETFVSFINGVSGSFSSNQLFFIVQDFINSYKPISFRITKISSGPQYSFATGFYNYSYEGIKGVAKFYISLKTENGSWRISQISIN